MSRRFQFSLKWLFAAMLVVAAFFGGVRLAPIVNDWMRAKRNVASLATLVDSFNRAIQEGRYKEADELAAQARYHYPNEPVSQQMENACKLLPGGRKGKK